MNRRITVLQTVALPLGYAAPNPAGLYAHPFRFLEYTLLCPEKSSRSIAKKRGQKRNLDFKDARQLLFR